MIGIGVVVVALVVAGGIWGLRGFFTQSPGSSPAVASGVPSSAVPGSAGMWSSMGLTVHNNTALPHNNTVVLDSGVEDIALVVTSLDEAQTACAVTAVDEVTLSVLWTISSACWLYPTAEGLVIIQFGDGDTQHVQVVDTMTGTVTASADIRVDQSEMSVGGGLLYTQFESGDSPDVQATGCARDLTLGPCLWQGPGNTFWEQDTSVAVFGNYSWINTDDGIRDLRTGARAPFDSGCDQGDGPSVDRVLCETWGGGLETIQQVDTTTGKAIGPPITPMALLSFSDDSEVYVVLQDVSDTHSHLIGYSWDTGQQVFDTTVDANLCSGECYKPDGDNVSEFGNSFWAQYADASQTHFLAAFSLSTGQMLWSGANADLVGATSVEGHSTVYVSNGSQLTAFDADTVQPVLTTDIPAGLIARISGNHVVAFDADTNTLWVLKAG